MVRINFGNNLHYYYFVTRLHLELLKKMEVGSKIDALYSLDPTKKWHFYRVTVSKDSDRKDVSLTC
jgi:hypothetical protein